MDENLQRASLDLLNSLHPGGEAVVAAGEHWGSRHTMGRNLGDSQHRFKAKATAVTMGRESAFEIPCGGMPY